MSGVDAVVSGLGGSNPIKFMRQYKDQGLTPAGARRRRGDG